MGVQLNYTFDLNNANHALLALEKADLQVLANDIGETIVEMTQFNFENERSPDGEPWIPSKRASENGDKTLQDTRRLYDSITYLAALDGSFVEVGSNVVYAAIHQAGGKAGRNKNITLPARPYLGLTGEHKAEIGDLVIDFYDELLNVPR